MIEFPVVCVSDPEYGLTITVLLVSRVGELVAGLVKSLFPQLFEVAVLSAAGPLTPALTVELATTESKATVS